MLKVGQHDAYLATPTNAKAERRKDAAILYIPDVLGIWQNSQLLADEYAENGYTTLVIDIFSGDAIPMNAFPGINLPDWIANGTNGVGGHTIKEIDPIVKEALAYLKNDLGFQRIGAAGYCFGAKYVVRHFTNGVDVGYIAHPSFVEEDEVSAVSGPLSIAAAETDSIFTVEKRHKTEELLQKTGQPYQINLYSGVTHGFAVRRSLEKKVERFGKKQAMRQALDFFDEWLL